MSGIGLPELLVIVAIVAILFGAPVLTFFVGYLVGKNRAGATPERPASAAAPAAAPAAPEVPAPTAEEPADE